MAVTFDGTRVDGAEAIGNKWSDLGGGKASDETDFKFHNTQSVSEKVNNSTGGIAFDDSGATANTEDLTNAVVLLKVLVTTVGLLSDRGPDGMNVELGSGGLRSAFFQWYFSGVDEYPANESWLIAALACTVLEWINETTGNPDETVMDYAGLEATIGGGSKAENVAMDAVDHFPIGTGLTWVGSTGSFQDFIDFDFGDAVNGRIGLVIEKDNIMYCLGTLTLGKDAASVFLAANRVVVFPGGFFGPGHLGIITGIGHASNDIDLNNNTLVGTGQDGQIHYFDNITSVDAANNEIDIVGHKFLDGDPVLYSLNGGSNAVGGLVDDTTYFVIVVTANAIALSDQRYAAEKGDTRLVLADASGFVLGGPITGDGDGGNDGVGVVVGINSNDVTVQTASGSWVSGNGVDNADPFVGDATTISSIESANGGLGLSDGATGENHKLTRTPDIRPDYTACITITVASGTNFVIGGPITGDGDNGNTGVGIVRSKPSANSLQVQTLSGAWVTTNGVDNADPYSADDTTISTIVATGDSDLVGGTLDKFRRINLFAGVSILDTNILNSSKVIPLGGLITGAVFSAPVLDEGEALITILLNDLDDLSLCDFTAGDEGHAMSVESNAGSPFAWNHNLSGYWAPAVNGWEFNSDTGVDAGTDIITMSGLHGFSDGDAVFHNREGGTDDIGIADGAKVYANAQTTTTISLHRSREDAVADANRLALTSAAGPGETQSFYSGKAAVFNDTGGAITINVNSGSTPSVRNGSGASTTVAASVTVTMECLDENGDGIQNVQCSMFLDSDLSEVLNADSNASGIATTGFSGSTPAGIHWRMRKGSGSGSGGNFKKESGIGTIETGTGFSVTQTLKLNPINAT